MLEIPTRARHSVVGQLCCFFLNSSPFFAILSMISALEYRVRNGNGPLSPGGFLPSLGLHRHGLPDDPGDKIKLRLDLLKPFF